MCRGLIRSSKVNIFSSFISCWLKLYLGSHIKYIILFTVVYVFIIWRMTSVLQKMLHSVRTYNK